ncbi:TetR/AcrR family transcriptional regulator [Agromyces laixinhei]|uniref:TetR/AcrR family transcriptional regulator n=1 Tax=Agromyces laixinhei TaxID=2585717 RepID=UPI001115E6DB|nr:TetR/AcrR family transcriptional regulator [Agromyces laixinhei]
MTRAHDSLGQLTPAAEKILATASGLFYAYGLHAVGVDRIAEESGVTKKTLYERFGSKEGLVLAYLRRREDQWRNALEQHLLQHPEPDVERVLAVFDAADLWYSGRSTKGCSAVNARAEASPEPEDQSIPREVTEQKTWMLDRFRELCAEAGYVDPDSLSRSLLLLLEGALVTLGTRSFPEPMRVARDTAHLYLLHCQPPSSGHSA